MKATPPAASVLPASEAQTLCDPFPLAVGGEPPPGAGLASGTLVGAALYLAAFVAYSGFIGTWTDEEYTLATTAHGLAYAWHRAIDYELQAPLYFAALALWRAIDTSVWFARLFSVLCATGFLLALQPILRRAVPGARAFWPALFIALNPFVVYSALDIRLYASALLISALGWLAFDAGFVAGRSFAARCTFVVIAIVALYTQYFLGFAFVGYAVALALRGRSRQLIPYAGALAVVAVAALPLLGIVRSQIGGSGETTQRAAFLLRQTVFHPALDFVLPYERSWDTLHVRGGYLVLAGVLVACALAARPWRATPSLTAAFGCALAIDALFVTVVLAFRLDLNTRHYVVLFVPAVVAGYALVAALEAGPWAALGKLLRAVYVGLTLATLYAQHHQVAQTGDTRRVAAYLAEHATAGSIVAIFPADALPAYARAYRGRAKLVPFPKALSARRYDIARIDVRDEREARIALARLPRARATWFVMMGACDLDTSQYGCDDVLAALRDATRIRSEKRFYQSRVFAITVRARVPSERSASGSMPAHRPGARRAP